MDPVRNPYIAGAGVQPPELAGREALLEDARVAAARILAGKMAKSFIAIGLRGVGKTVLLNRSKAICADLGFRTAFLEAHEQKKLPELLVTQLRSIALELDRLGSANEWVKRALRALKGFAAGSKLSARLGEAEIALRIDPEPGLADSGDIEADLPDLFASIGRAAVERGRAVALFVDEFQYLSDRDMSALIMALHRASQEGLPVLMMAAGLPQVIGLTGRSKSYSERLFDFPQMKALGSQDARRAIAAPAQAEGVTFEEQALDEVIRVTEGYPYFPQEWAYHVWNTSEGPRVRQSDVEGASRRAIERLDQGFFRVRLDRLTPAERDYLRAMAELGPGPHRSADVAAQLGLSTGDVGARRDKLIKKGMIYSQAHGETSFTVPLFDAFMRREIPEWNRRRGRH